MTINYLRRKAEEFKFKNPDKANAVDTFVSFLDEDKNLTRKGLDSNLVYRLYESGKTYADLMQRFGVSYSTIAYHLKKARGKRG